MNQYCLLVLGRIYRVSQETNVLNFSMSKFSYDSIGLVGSLSLQDYSDCIAGDVCWVCMCLFFKVALEHGIINHSTETGMDGGPYLFF